MFDLELTWDRPAQLNAHALQTNRRDNNHVLRVRIKPRNLPSLPLRMAIALDTSESMTGEKLQQAKAACRAVISQLRDIDQLSLAGYSTKVIPLLQALTGGDEAVTSAEKAITELQAGGVTRMDLGLNWIQKSLPPEESTALVGILITDGHATNKGGVPLDDVTPLIEKAKEMRNCGITLCSLGLGDTENGANFNTSFLNNLSNQGGGAFIYADTPNKLSQLLQKQLTAYQAIVAVDAKLRLTLLATGVKPTGYCRLSSEYLPLEETNKNELNLGIIRSDPPTDILIRLDIPPLTLGFRESLGSRDMISVELITACGQETPISQTAAITYTNSFREAQIVNTEVDRDRLYWDINLYVKEVNDIGDDDPNRTAELLTNIQLTATQAGATDIANQAAQMSEDLRNSGKLNRETATETLRDSSNLGGIGGPIPEPPFNQYTAQLKLLNVPGLERQFPLNQVKTVIGRNDPANDITVDIDLSDCESNSPTVSRPHAEISWVEGKLQIVDLGSRHGTFVNGEKLPPFVDPKKLPPFDPDQPSSPVSLKPGSKVKLGNLEFEVIKCRNH